MKTQKIVTHLMIFALTLGMLTPHLVQAKSKVTLNKKSLTMTVGQKKTLKVKGTKKKAKWSSSKKKVATVSKKGVVKAKKAGKAKITAKIGKKKYTCKVTVKKKNNSNNKTNNNVNNNATNNNNTSNNSVIKTPDTSNTEELDKLKKNVDIIYDKTTGEGRYLLKVRNKNKVSVNVDIEFIFHPCVYKIIEIEEDDYSRTERELDKSQIAMKKTVTFKEVLPGTTVYDVIEYDEKKIDIYSTSRCNVSVTPVASSKKTDAKSLISVNSELRGDDSRNPTYVNVTINNPTEKTVFVSFAVTYNRDQFAYLFFAQWFDFRTVTIPAKESITMDMPNAPCSLLTDRNRPMYNILYSAYTVE